MEITYQTRSFFLNSPILVLDASFNPPHRAHYELIKLAAFQYYYNNNKNKNNSNNTCLNLNLLLSYSPKNADKGLANLKDQKFRNQMIRLFADYYFPTISTIKSSSTSSSFWNSLNINWAIAIAISPSPKFVDKSKDIISWLSLKNLSINEHHTQSSSSSLTSSSSSNNINLLSLNNFHNPGNHEIIFLMGFDTLSRLLDSKYYKNNSHNNNDNNNNDHDHDDHVPEIIKSLNYFFKHSFVMALPRGELNPEITKNEWLKNEIIEQQNDNDNNNKSIKYYLPDWWDSRIYILKTQETVNVANKNVNANANVDVNTNTNTVIEIEKVSSTIARIAAFSNDYKTLEKIVENPKIVEFIKENNLYK